jgi:hypothetical protein
MYQLKSSKLLHAYGTHPKWGHSIIIVTHHQRRMFQRDPNRHSTVNTDYRRICNTMQTKLFDNIMDSDTITATYDHDALVQHNEPSAVLPILVYSLLNFI